MKGTGLGTRRACVHMVDVTPMSVAVMPILESFVGHWHVHGRCSSRLLVAWVLMSSTPARSGAMQRFAPVVRGTKLELLHVDGLGRLAL